MHQQAGPDTVARIEIFEGIRGFLAVWVMAGHLIYFLAIVPYLYGAGSPWWKLLNAIRKGVTPVSLFMIISGFVISHLIITRREPYKAYIVRRFLRLFPAFACCFILGIFISPWQSSLQDLPWGNETWVNYQAELAGLHRAFILPNIVAHMTLLHGLVPKTWWPDANGAFLGVGWSISTEWQFYLVAPLLIWAARRRLGLALISMLIICLSPVFPFTQHLNIFNNTSQSLLLFHIQYFFIGGVCYRLWTMWSEYLANRGSGRPAPRGLVLCGAAVAFLIPDLTLAIWVFIFSCLCQIAAKPDGMEARAVRAVACSEPAMFIGRISYSIYLVHWPITIIMLQLKYLQHLSPMVYWGVFIVSASLVTIGVSTLLYYYIEAPAIRWGKKLFKEDQGPPGISSNPLEADKPA